MTKTRGKRACIAVAVMMFLLASSAIAWPGKHKDQEGDGPGLEGRAHGFMRNLNLTPEQIKLLKKDKIQKKKQMIKLQADLETMQIDLADESTQDNPDMKKISTLAGKMGVIHGRMIEERVRSIIYLRSILDPEQKKNLDAQALQFKGLGGFHKGKRGGKRGPREGKKDK
jgi:Spy/CpxP family protein refolding chaperone